MDVRPALSAVLLGALLAVASSVRAGDVKGDPLVDEFLVTIGSPSPGDPDAMVFHLVITGSTGPDLLVEARWGETPMKARGRRLADGGFALRLATRETPTLGPSLEHADDPPDPAAAEELETYWTLLGRVVALPDVHGTAVRLEGSAEIVEVQADVMRKSTLRFTGAPVSDLEVEPEAAPEPNDPRPVEVVVRTRRPVVGDGRAQPVRHGQVAALRAALSEEREGSKARAPEHRGRHAMTPAPAPASGAARPVRSTWLLAVVGVVGGGVAIVWLLRDHARARSTRSSGPAPVATIAGLAALPTDRLGRQLTLLKLRRAMSPDAECAEPAEAEVMARFRAGVAALAAFESHLQALPASVDPESATVGHVAFNSSGTPAVDLDGATVPVPRKKGRKIVSVAASDPEHATVRVPRKARKKTLPATGTIPTGSLFPAADGSSPAVPEVTDATTFAPAPPPPPPPAVLPPPLLRTVPTAALFSAAPAPPPPPPPAVLPPPVLSTVPTAALFPPAPAPPPPPAPLSPVLRTVPTAALFPPAPAPPPPPPAAPPPPPPAPLSPVLRTVPTAALFPPAPAPPPLPAPLSPVLRTVPTAALFPPAPAPLAPPPPPSPVLRTVPTAALFPTVPAPPPPAPLAAPIERTMPTAALFPSAPSPPPASAPMNHTVPTASLFPGARPAAPAEEEPAPPRRRKTPVPDLGPESWLAPSDDEA